MMNYYFIFLLEFKLILRRKQEWLYPLSFFCLVIILFPLIFSPENHFLKTYAPGCIWFSALFASLLSIENIFQPELEEAHLIQLILSNVSLTHIIFIKVVLHWIMLQLPIVLLTPFIAFILQLSFPVTALIMLTLLIGTPILVLLNTFGISLTLGLKQPGLLLGLLILPLALPVIIFGVNIVTQYQAGFDITGPLCFSLALLILALTFLPLAIAEVLRLSQD